METIPLPALSPVRCLQQLRNCTEKQAKHPQNQKPLHLEMNLWRVGKEWKGHGREKAVLWNNPETRAYAWDKRWHIRVDGLLKVPGNVGYWLCGFVEEAGTSVITKLVSYEWGRLFSEGWEPRALREAASVWRVGLVVCSHVWISIYLYRESLYENTLWINFLTSME